MLSRTYASPRLRPAPAGGDGGRRDGGSGRAGLRFLCRHVSTGRKPGYAGT